MPFIAPFPSLGLQAKIYEKGVLDEVFLDLWLPGATLNYAENLLVANRTDGVVAITATGESGAVTSCTSRELCEMVWVMAEAVKVHKWKVGDQVVVWQPFTLVNVLRKTWMIRSRHKKYIFKYCDRHGDFCKASKRA